MVPITCPTILFESLLHNTLEILGIMKLLKLPIREVKMIYAFKNQDDLIYLLATYIFFFEIFILECCLFFYWYVCLSIDLEELFAHEGKKC